MRRAFRQGTNFAVSRPLGPRHPPANLHDGALMSASKSSLARITADGDGSRTG
jgi:hypothetical protein